MTYTLNGTDLGTVERERGRKDPDLQKMRMPLSDSSSALVFDFSGTLRFINLEGTYYAASKTALYNFINTLETLVSGNQSAITYHSDLGSTASGTNYSVYIDDWSWEYIGGAPNAIRYRITLVEGS